MQVKSTVLFVKVKLLFIYFGSTSVSKDYQQIFQYMHFKFEKDFFLTFWTSWSLQIWLSWLQKDTLSSTSVFPRLHCPINDYLMYYLLFACSWWPVTFNQGLSGLSDLGFIYLLALDMKSLDSRALRFCANAFVLFCAIKKSCMSVLLWGFFHIPWKFMRLLHWIRVDTLCVLHKTDN